ncbi:MAG TPA: V-type ATP synthase subunit D [Spirochaetales bacterium]|nr:V-type ATP synthase subunit D [Spirochaetales bacterium]
MPRLNVPPTKSNLFQYKEQLAVAREGFELLEQKRDILVMELMRMLEQVKLVEAELYRLSEKAYTSLRKTLLSLGRETVNEISKGIRYEFTVKERNIKVAGLNLPTLEVQPPSMELQYSLMDTYTYTDETMQIFLEYLKIIAEMASVRNMAWRLAKEVKKTQRRVNALEKMVIPDTAETVSYISSTLEEREREIFFIQKMLKSRREVNG